MPVKKLSEPMKYQRRRQFTLVEIMVVIVIISVILGITVPVFNSIATRSSVDAAASMIASALRLARAEAAQKRLRVGILFYVQDKKDIENADVYVCTSWQYVYKDGSADRKLQNTKKEFLPLGAVIKFTSGYGGEYKVYFKPSGQPKVYIKLSGQPEEEVTAGEISLVFNEGTVAENGKYIPLNKDNVSKVKVNRYTGNVKVVRKSE